MSNRSYLVPRPPAFDHEHPRPKEEGEVLYCGNCQKWYVSWFPLTEVKTISLDIYRLFEKWLDEQKETER